MPDGLRGLCLRLCLFQPGDEWIDTVLVMRGLDSPALGGSPGYVP